MNLAPRLLIAPLFLLLGGSIYCQTDAMVRTRTTMTMSPARPNEENPTVIRSAYYQHGTMRRRDTLSDKGIPIFTQLKNCATLTGYIVDREAREYRAIKLPTEWAEPQLREYLIKHPESAVRVESRTVDTGERKVFFGLTAKHFVTTVERPTKDGVGGMETIDGWYVEQYQWEDTCNPTFAPWSELTGAILVSYPEIPDPRHVGPIPAGLAVKMKHTIKWTGGWHGPNGQTLTDERVVEDISSSPLNPAMFEVPAGFRENPQLLKPSRATQPK